MNRSERKFSWFRPDKRMRRLERAFWSRHEADPYIYKMMCGEIRNATDRGVGRRGISYFYERLRWLHDFKTDEPEFKLSNNHRSMFARLWMLNHREFPNFFRLRKCEFDGDDNVYEFMSPHFEQMRKETE